MNEYIVEKRQTSGGWTWAEPKGELIRCKDCKHRPSPKKPAKYKTGFDLYFPDEECPCQCDDGYYSWYPKDNWFCGNAERKEENKND